MLRWRFLPVVLIFILILAACIQRNEDVAVGIQPTDTANITENPPNTCPVTKPPDPAFIPPESFPTNPPGTDSWYGGDAFWTTVTQNGVWYALPHNTEGYTQKVFWWSNGYSFTKEPEPNLTVTGQRLDGNAPALHVSKASNAEAGDIGSAMLVGVDIPTLGCWEITGEYKDAKLSFVVWVAP